MLENNTFLLYFIFNVINPSSNSYTWAQKIELTNLVKNGYQRPVEQSEYLQAGLISWIL